MQALFISNRGDHLTYDRPHQLLEHRWKRSRSTKRPGPHDFWRAFALNMRRNGVDVFALQKMPGHSDLPIRRRYLAQNNTDTQVAQMRGSPVEDRP